MTWSWRFDATTAKVGDTVFVSSGGGVWGLPTVTRYTVAKITPGGQIVCKLGEAELRINKRGTIVGSSSSWDRRRLISAEDAADIAKEAAQVSAWHKVRVAADNLGGAARRKDPAAAREALKAATEALALATTGDAP